MSLSQKLEKALTEIREISRIEGAVYTGEGKLLASTFQILEDLDKKVCQFFALDADMLTREGFHFFRVPATQTEEDYVLVVKALVEESHMVGRLAVCQFRNLIEAEGWRTNKSSFLRQVLCENIGEETLHDQAKKMRIPDSEWVVYVIRAARKRDPACIETLRNLCLNREQDFVIEMEEQGIVLVKDAQEMEHLEELESLAKMISDNVQSEAMQQISIGYGRKAKSLLELPRSYREAQMALEVGKIFYGQNSIFSFDRLGIGRLIYRMPEDLCEKFVEEIFAGKEKLLNEEDFFAAQRFFDNNLNISETARQMYLHRNTLVYRLERIEKAVGLDVRKFEDAIKFKVACMVRDYLNYKK